jgi:hypothetical protein
MHGPKYDETISRIVHGEEELQMVSLMQDAATASKPVSAMQKRSVRRRARQFTAPRPTPATKTPPNASLSEMVASKRSEFGGGPPPSEEWQRIPIGDRIEIGIRGKLRRRQMEQVAIVGELLRTIVEER